MTATWSTSPQDGSSHGLVRFLKRQKIFLARLISEKYEKIGTQLTHTGAG